MLRNYFAATVMLSGLALIAGCSSSRDVEVSGKVSAGSVSSEITLEFFDVNGSDKTSVHTAKLGDDGSFKETVSIEGDEVLVRAIADADGNAKCTEGEQWGEASAKISDDDKAGPIEVALSLAACPK